MCSYLEHEIFKESADFRNYFEFFQIRTICVRMLAVDPSLTSSGWALFEGAKLIGVGHIKTKVGPIAPRLESIQSSVTELLTKCGLNADSVVVCEDATTMVDPSSALKLEQVRGIFECCARALGATVPGRINPRSVQSALLGMRGSQVKREAVKAAAVEVVRYHYSAMLQQLNFPTSIAHLTKHQDICDAVLVGHMALLRMEEARRLTVPLWEVFEIRRRRARGWKFVGGD